MESDDPMERRCTAKNRQGERCGKPPIRGGTVCRMHGGAAPQVEAKAEERLQRLADGPAIDCYEELVSPGMRQKFPTTALGAARDLVNRRHGVPRESVDMNVTGLEQIAEILRLRRERHASTG